MVCQCANVNQILMSIGGICDKGSHVHFRADGGDIISLSTKKKTPFRRLRNNYVLDAWVENSNWKMKKKSPEISQKFWVLLGRAARGSEAHGSCKTESR